MTNAQRQVLRLFRDDRPSLREIAAKLGYKSATSAHVHCSALADAGYLERAETRRARGYSITAKGRRVLAAKR